jgi:hypothetical protein
LNVDRYSGPAIVADCLGHVALRHTFVTLLKANCLKRFGVPDGIRTRVIAVKERIGPVAGLGGMLRDLVGSQSLRGRGASFTFGTLVSIGGRLSPVMSPWRHRSHEQV